MDIKRRAMGGMAWTSLSFGLRQGLQLLIGIVLARVLLPEHFGLVALANVALGIVGLLRNTGLSQAVVRQPAITDDQLTSTFWFNNALNAVLTLAFLASAPAIAGLLDEPRVLLVLVALAPNFLLSSLSSVHGALLTRNRNYRRLAVRETFAAIAAGAIAVAAALAGAGLYALVLQSLASNLFSLALLWGTVPWRPRLHFGLGEVKPLLAFGLPLGGAQVVHYLVRNLDNLLVGRFLGAVPLGLYVFAYATVLVPVQVVQSILGRVMFPEMSAIQADLAKVRTVYLQSLRYIAAVVWLPLGGLLALAPVAVPLVYGDHWSQAAPLVQLFSLVAIGQALATTVGWIYNSQGRSKQQFWMTLAFCVPIYLSFIIGLRWGVLGVTAAYTIVNYVLAWPYNEVAFRIIGLTTGKVLRQLGRIFLALCALVASLTALRLGWREWVGASPALLLAAGILLGTAVYVAALWMLERDLVRAVVRLPGELRAKGKVVPGP